MELRIVAENNILEKLRKMGEGYVVRRNHGLG